MDINDTLVIIGNDPGMNVDLSAFRSVRESTGMKFTRLVNPTLARLQSFITLTRLGMGGKLPNIHFAAHMSFDGIRIQDSLLTPDKISELFSGCGNMFLAGCESVDLVLNLGSIDNVLSFIEKVDNTDALSFSLVFWAGIGNGHTAKESYDEACNFLPAVAEFSHLQTNDFLSRIGKRKT